MTFKAWHEVKLLMEHSSLYSVHPIQSGREGMLRTPSAKEFQLAVSWPFRKVWKHGSVALLGVHKGTCGCGTGSALKVLPLPLKWDNLLWPTCMMTLCPISLFSQEALRLLLGQARLQQTFICTIFKFIMNFLLCLLNAAFISQLIWFWRNESPDHNVLCIILADLLLRLFSLICDYYIEKGR